MNKKKAEEQLKRIKKYEKDYKGKFVIHKGARLEFNEDPYNIEERLQFLKENPFQYIQEFDGAMPSRTCDDIIDFFNSDKALLSHGSLGPHTVNKGKKDAVEARLGDNAETMPEGMLQFIMKVFWTPFNIWLHTTGYFGIHRYRMFLEQNVLLRLPGYFQARDVVIRKYPAGGNGYKAIHYDRMGNSYQAKSRIGAGMLYLNTVKNGGGTYFVSQDKTVDAVKGRLALFPSDVTHFHCGMPSDEDKYCIVFHIIFNSVDHDYHESGLKNIEDLIVSNRIHESDKKRMGNE